MVCHPAPSAFALARARLGWAVAETAELSACGRPIDAIVPLLQPGARLLVLSADADTPAALAALLCADGLGALPADRARSAWAARPNGSAPLRADGFDLPDIHALNTVAIEVVGAVRQHLATGLPDELFEHDGQLTRREIRAVTLSALAPRRGERLWDVGGGAGSIGIEWMLRHPANLPSRSSRTRCGLPALPATPRRWASRRCRWCKAAPRTPWPACRRRTRCSSAAAPTGPA